MASTKVITMADVPTTAITLPTIISLRTTAGPITHGPLQLRMRGDGEGLLGMATTVRITSRIPCIRRRLSG